jgi:hypothetical protein
MKRSALFLGLAIVVAFALTASSETNIDYSHDIVGTGTIMTDYKMTSPQSTEASGKVRGTGDVMNKYIFSASNDSENVTIEDQFTLSSATVTREITLSDYPQIPKRTPDFRLLGTDWARGLTISEPEIAKEGGKKNQSIASSDPEKGASFAGKGEFNFQGESTGDTNAVAATNVKDSSNLDARASLIINRGKGIFDYQSSWLNSSSVAVRSAVGARKTTLYEDEGSINGSSSGQKRLIVSSQAKDL